MILNVQENAPPHDKEVVIVVIKKTFVHKSSDGQRIFWSPINEDLTIGYLLPDEPVLKIIPKAWGR